MLGNILGVRIVGVGNFGCHGLLGLQGRGSYSTE